MAYSTSPRATGSTRAARSEGSIWLSPAMTQRDVDAFLERAAVAGDDRRSDAAVALVLDQLDAPVRERLDALSRPILRPVVHDDDPVDEVGDAGQRRPDQRLLVVGGNHDGDALALEHLVRRYGLAARPAPKPARR